MTNDLKTIQQSILLYLLYKISVQFNQAKILKCKMGLVPWLNWLIFHLQVLASHMDTSSCPSCSTKAPCLRPEKAVEDGLSGGRPGKDPWFLASDGVSSDHCYHFGE